MSQKKVYVSFLLDRSGSMASHKGWVIDAFNEYISGIKDDDRIVFTLTTFDSEGTDVVFDAVPVSEVPPLTDRTYQPRAATPLYDAIGQSVGKIEKVIKKGGYGKKKQRVLFIILTDGEENASQEYSRRNAFDLIRQKESLGWTVTYLGANQDAYAVGMGLGVHPGNVANYSMDNLKPVAAGMSSATLNYARRGGAVTDSLFDDAGVDIAQFEADEG